MKDKDGFHILKRRDEPSKKKKKGSGKIKLDIQNQPAKAAKPKIKFKKGGWKWELWKKIKEWPTSHFTKAFHSTEMTDYGIGVTDDGELQVVSRKGGFKYADRKFMKGTYGNGSFIFVPCGNDMYTRLPLKSYKKLMKIDKVAISFKLKAWYDGEEECDGITSYSDVFVNINSLLGFINYHRQGILGVYEIQANCCAYTDFVWDFKVMVYEQDGTIKTYKSDMNDFMLDYGLHPF